MLSIIGYKAEKHQISLKHKNNYGQLFWLNGSIAFLYLPLMDQARYF